MESESSLMDGERCNITKKSTQQFLNFRQPTWLACGRVICGQDSFQPWAVKLEYEPVRYPDTRQSRPRVPVSRIDCETKGKGIGKNLNNCNELSKIVLIEGEPRKYGV